MTKILSKRFPCEICSKVDLIQVFYRADGTVRYGRARHYQKRLNGKPQFQYHQQSLEYLQRKLCDITTEELNHKDSISSEAPLNNEHIVHGEQHLSDEPQNKAQNCLVSKSKAWASSSIRIEHQPLLGLVIFLLSLFCFFALPYLIPLHTFLCLG